jgi:predicted DNA-binding protein (UPF0278 family)
MEELKNRRQKMSKEEKTITLGNELYEEFIEGKQTIDTHELLNLFAKRINNLQSKIDKGIEYCEEVIKEHNNGEYNVSTVELAVKEHKGNIENVLDLLKEDK